MTAKNFRDNFFVDSHTVKTAKGRNTRLKPKPHVQPSSVIFARKQAYALTDYLLL